MPIEPVLIIIVILSAIIAVLVYQLFKTREIARQLLDKIDTIKKTNGELFHITAHDLQEPLRKIQAFGDRLKSLNWKMLDLKSQDYLLYIINAADRMQDGDRVARQVSSGAAWHVPQHQFFLRIDHQRPCRILSGHRARPPPCGVQLGHPLRE